MRMNNYKIKIKTVFIALLIFLMGCAILGYSFINDKSANALSDVPETTTVTNPIYSFDSYCYDTEALDMLAKQVLGNNSATIDTLITYAKNEAGTAGKPISNKDITLQYGRYRYSAQNSYNSLVWMPVYVSRTNDISGDAILTLYLSATSTLLATSQQETGFFSNIQSYSTNYAANPPSNSYGTSYIRAFSLGNGGEYAYYSGTNASSATMSKADIYESRYNKYSDFVQGSDFKGLLYDDIVTPSSIAWQANESYTEYVDENSYCWPNDAYEEPSSGSYYYPDYFNYSNKTNYTVWKDDKVWLPSVTEVGNGDRDGNGVGTLNGIWELNKNQRSNTQDAWLRSAANNVNKTNGYSTYTMFCTTEDGSITTHDLNDSPYGHGFQGLAIRPAIHLNLSKIKTKTTPPVNLPDMDKGQFVSTVYNGEEQVIRSDFCTLTPEQIPWFVADGSMIVNFYAEDDEECANGAVTAKNAGTYIMLVQLRGNNQHFLGEDESVRLKKAKFIIEKAKIGIEWQYDDESIPSIKNVVGEYYPDDVANGMVPEVSMYYRKTGGTGKTFYEFPDEKGYYEAYAYIVDEDKRNYNYELAELNGNKIKSNQFYVKQKPIDEPYFKELGEGATTLERSYKGRQYIEIANISSYLEIDVTADRAGALDSLVEIGLTDEGVMVYRVEAVANYTFTVKIKDTVNIMWTGGTENNPDVAPRTLHLDIVEAEITVSFDGLPSSWETNRQMNFNLVISGVQAGEDSSVEMRVYYLSPTGSMVTLNKDESTGQYVIKSGLSVGIYTLVATLAGTGQYEGNYQMTSAKTQKFEIVRTVSTFNESLVRWQYSVGGRNTSLSNLGTGNTQNDPVSLRYTGDYYQVMLTIDEARLATYYVRAIYTGYKLSETDNTYKPFDGAKYVKNAGSYLIKVNITALDKNVIFTPQEYNLYFKIEQATFDLTGVQWDYSSPYTYTGSEQKVLLKADTLPTGLTPSYIANTATNAGNYTSSVRFLVSEEYAANYIVPDPNDDTTYTGNFNFNCDWQINKQEIAIVWETDNSSSDLLVIPTLRNGGSLVDYTFEHLVNGSWVACDSVQPAQTVTEKYRVSATLKSVYENNYELTGSTDPYEFEVQSGKLPVTIHFEVNNVRCEDGDEIAYTGREFHVTVVSDSGAQVTSTVEYYALNADGTRGSKLDGAPIDIGSYIAVVSVSFSSDSYLTDESQTEVSFKIVKADIDTSELQWECTHGNDVVTATYDADTQKWVDSNGKEVTFSFEYDGTPYSFALVGLADGLTIGNTTGNTATNVGEYDAVVSFSWSDNYNEPAFPASLHWSITKATIHFDDVKWGYIDAEGNEHEFDFVNDSFVFTRDENSFENGPVKFTVGLINIPDGVKELITYKSICLTQPNSVEVDGNSFSAVGQYKTTMTMMGTFTDPNYETFRAENLPASIPTFLEWEISRRQLTKTSYDYSWTDFDNRTHDLIELSGIPREELCYYQVEITFLDTANGVYNYYEGYEGVPYTGFYAGTYTVRFYELVGDEAEPIFWDSVEIEVGRHKLEVTWDLKGSIPVARVTGVYVSDMIGTRYTNTSYGDVTVAFIQSTNGEQEFIAMPFVTEKYAKNLDFEMAFGQKAEVFFRYEQFIKTDSSTPIDKSAIEFARATAEYTGEPITFELLWWESEFAPYLYYEGDSLTQTDVGVYHIVISFIKYDSQTGAGDAYWLGTDGERNSIELEFEIVPRTSVPLEYPKFNMYSAVYTGNEIVFEITNWIVLKDYIYYKVTWNGQDRGTNLTQVNAGIYTVTFNFYEDSIGFWNADPTNPKKEYVVQFEITDPNSTTKTLLDPKLQYNNTVTNTAKYTGGEITFSIVDWDSYYAQYVEVVGSLTATNPGTYTVTLAVKTGVDAVFSNGKDTYTISYTIVSSDPDAPVSLEKPHFVDASKPYTGSAILFELADWASVYEAYLEISGDSLTQTASGEYSITISFKASSKAYWAETNGREDIVLKFYVLEETNPGDDEPVRINPDDVFIVVDVKEFTGKEIQFDLNNWEYLRDYVTIDGGADYLSLLKTEVGEYTISVEIKNPNKATWVGGSIAPISLKFRITKATLTLGDGNGNIVDEDGKLIITNGDGNRVEIDDYLDYVYRDEDGNIVPGDQLEEGKNYYVSVELKPGKEEDFNKNFTNGTDGFKQTVDDKVNSQNGGKGVAFTKSKKGGLSTMLIVTIAVCGVLILLVIATIVVLAIKRRQFEEEDVVYVDYEEGDY